MKAKKTVPAPVTTTTQTIDEVLAERGARYGSFIGHAQITQDLELVMVRTSIWEDLRPTQRECLHMIAHKIGRILNGDPDYVDSWTDIIGYTRLVEKELLGEEV